MSPDLLIISASKEMNELKRAWHIFQRFSLWKKKRDVAKFFWRLASDFLPFFRLRMHEKQDTVQKAEKVEEGAMPAYILDRQEQSRAKILSNMIKQKRKEKAVSYRSESRSSNLEP